MRANAEVLIVEDDAETLEELRAHFARKHFHPLATRSAAHAIAALRNNAASTRPVLAVVDWDLSKAPDQSLTSLDVLSLLSRQLSDCLTIVYSANIDSFRVRSEIHRAHPRRYGSLSGWPWRGSWLRRVRGGSGTRSFRGRQLFSRFLSGLVLGVLS